MKSISKKSTLITLGLTATVCSRTIFFFFNDPEGPNLLIVVVMAAAIYVVSLLAYFSRLSNIAKLVAAIFIQIAIAIALYFCLR